MKAAFACWQNRIAPVFDVARHVRLVEAASGRIISETDAELPGDSPDEKALHLAGFGVDTLVCGAISRFVQAVIAAMQAHAARFKAHGGAVATLKKVKTIDPAFSSASSVPEARRAEVIEKLNADQPGA